LNQSDRQDPRNTYACGPYNLIKVEGWQAMVNLASSTGLHMQLEAGYMAKIIPT